MPRPMDDNDIEDLDSSTSSATLDDQQTDKVEAGTAESSAADGVTKEADTLSVVRDVVEAGRSATKAASPADGDDDGQTAGASVSKKEPDDENFTDVPFNKHPRFQQLLRERNANRGDAQRYRNVENYLSNAGLVADEAADVLRIAGLAKVNPAEAWKQVRPWVQNLLIAAGEVLPEDLQARVQRQELTPEAATEISRHRATIQSHQVSQQFQEKQQADREQQEGVNARMGAAAAWEADRRLKDPNFAAKEASLHKEVNWLQRQEGVPRTPEGVREQLVKAYKAVNEAFRPATPAPTLRPKPAIIPVRGGQSNGSAIPGPQNTLDIVRANRRSATR